ncbi:hypothetical protein Pelo_19872 [Pelomyxa schiedti]|nr:hypothetical protein Pelo_19872 [Pelomyxa schiedti]
MECSITKRFNNQLGIFSTASTSALVHCTCSDLDQLEEAFSREQQATGRTGDHDTTVEVLQREFEIDINKYGDFGASITETDNS